MKQQNDKLNIAAPYLSRFSFAFFLSKQVAFKTGIGTEKAPSLTSPPTAAPSTTVSATTTATSTVPSGRTRTHARNLAYRPSPARSSRA